MSVCHKSWCLKTRHSPVIPSKFWVCPRYWENTNMMSCTPTQLSGMQLSHRWELFLIENRLFLRASNQILIHLNPRSELWVRDTSREHVQNTSTKTKTKNSAAHTQGYRVLQGYNPSNRKWLGNPTSLMCSLRRNGKPSSNPPGLGVGWAHHFLPWLKTTGKWPWLSPHFTAMTAPLETCRFSSWTFQTQVACSIFYFEMLQGPKKWYSLQLTICHKHSTRGFKRSWGAASVERSWNYFRHAKPDSLLTWSQNVLNAVACLMNIHHSFFPFPFNQSKNLRKLHPHS